MSVYLGIDFGTSGARAIAIDQAGQVCAQVSDRFAPNTAHAWIEDWQSLLFQLLRRIPQPIRANLQAIAINGTSSTVLLCDREGQPLDVPLLYNDARGISELPALQAFLSQDCYLDAPGRDTVLSATSSLIKLLWWRQQPIFARARYLMHQADWLAFLLHGQPGISDYHNCLKLGYDVANLKYPDWLAELGVMPVLPTVVEPGSPIAPIQAAIVHNLDIPTTCLIKAGTTDSIAAFLASGATSPGEAVTSLGSTLVVKLLSETPVNNQTYGIYSHRLGNLWLVGGASNTGGAVLQQFFTPAELTQLSLQIPTGRPSPLNYYPLPKPGERFPINDPNLPPHLAPRPADPVEFLQGLLESMARIEAQAYTLLQELGATPLIKVYTAGGGAANAAWTALRDRHLPVPVLPSQHTEAAYGTAQLARQPG